MSHITADETIPKLKQIFSCFEISQILVSDNGTAFTSATFSNFCALNDIQHIRTPPFHPLTNGQVEHFVDTFKRIFIKPKGRDPCKKYWKYSGNVTYDVDIESTVWVKNSVAPSSTPR